jgi:predicted GNAT superfamily acetyltransferase
MAEGQEEKQIAIRRLETHEDMADAVRLQKEIWGFEDIELLPLRLFVVASKVGGQVFGAFDGGDMIAFLLAIPGMKPGGVQYLHSHMMGVLPEYRNTGIGRRLKLEQRQEAIRRGIQLVEWTFDPLELKNAYFNMERLGAVVRRYVLNQYGVTTSKLHGGLPTDRCVAEWYLNSARVRGIVDGEPFHRPAPVERVEVPAEIAAIRSNDPKSARQIQAGISEKFLHYTSQGLAVTGVEKTARTYSYLFSPWDSESN